MRVPTLVCLAAPLAALALAPHARHPRGLDLGALRARGARATFYDVGLGACGKTNSASEFVIALNTHQWDGGAHCFETVTIAYGGHSTQAQIVDECEGCPYGGIDMSRGLFGFFADESEGVLAVDWGFGAAPKKPAPKPAPSSTPPPATSAPATTHAPKHSSAAHNATSAAVPVPTPVPAPAAPAAPPPPPAPRGPQNLADLTALVAALGQIVLSPRPLAPAPAH